MRALFTVDSQYQVPSKFHIEGEEGGHMELPPLCPNFSHMEVPYGSSSLNATLHRSSPLPTALHQLPNQLPLGQSYPHLRVSTSGHYKHTPWGSFTDPLAGHMWNEIKQKFAESDPNTRSSQKCGEYETNQQVTCVRKAWLNGSF